jgi:hypothetical protein
MTSCQMILACLLALGLAGGTGPARADGLEDALLALEGRFEWHAGRAGFVFSDRPALAAPLEPAPEAQLATLAACTDDPRPARATLEGQAVSLGALCYQALRLVAYVETAGWPGHIGPQAGPAERLKAREAWQAAIAGGHYRLH